MQHTLMVVAFGLVALGVFVAIASLVRRMDLNIDGAFIFIWVWLAASLVNGAFGVVYADTPTFRSSTRSPPSSRSSGSRRRPPGMCRAA